jgi:hypothetical protein
MKYKTFLLLFLSPCFSFLSAQSAQSSTHKLSWKAVERWYSGSMSMNVISFEGSQYPSDDRLPYFNQRITCDPAFSYEAELKDAVYIPLTNDEKAIIEGKEIKASDAEIKTNLLSEQKTIYFDVQILPFANKDGKILKLESFNLQIKKVLRPQKTVSTNLHSYASASVLSQGRFVKIRITESGVYKLRYEDLTSMGIDPVNVRIFGYGGGQLEQDFLLPKIDDLPELAIYMDKGSDGVFNAGDYVLFYAQGVNRWIYDKTNAMFVHNINTYSQYGYYFVTSDAGTGRKITDKITSAPPQSSAISPVEEFVDYQVYEKDEVSIIRSGKELYDDVFKTAGSTVLSFNFSNQVSTSPTKVRLDVAASSTAPSSFTLNLNNTQTKTLTVQAIASGSSDEAIPNSAVYSFTPQGDTFNFNLSYLKSESGSTGYLNYLEVNARRKLIMTGSVMQFQNVDYLNKGYYSQYKLTNAGDKVQIWDITDPQNVNRISTEKMNGNLTFIASGNDERHYIAIDPTASGTFPIPVVMNVVPNQNLHGIAQADMVILTHPDFVSQAQALAKAHRDKDNLTVEVVTTEQVYNEFSSGTPDATAYRWVMKMLFDRATGSSNSKDMPKYLLLFGRGTFDNRKITSAESDNFILTYQADNSLNTISSYVTDDYFGLLNDNKGTNLNGNLLDIAVGRFPVTTAQQATNVVNKTIAYINNTGKGIWKNQLCFLGDDGGNNGDGISHMSQADKVAVSVGSKFPAFQVNKIYLDAFQQEYSATGESYPSVCSKFQNLLQKGLFLVDYTGHAGPSGWSNENIFTTTDVRALSNKHLPVFVGATCDFSDFDNNIVSGGEEVILNPAGGGIGILAAARPVLSGENFPLNQMFCDNLFRKEDGEHMRVGAVVTYAKNNVGSQLNKLSYIYFGDPAVKLNYPTKYQIITSNINESAALGNDTLRALSEATIQGFIADDNGTKVTGFNGVVHATIYDKMQHINTLNNHGDGSMVYDDRPFILFSGNAEVKNGAFSFTFKLPKDIKYNYGTGRINYYAQDDDNDFEAQGYFENFVVGGSCNSTIDELNGPDVQLYLNSENFVSGNKVNESPLFIANVTDPNGINTVGSGIGHDVLLTLDQDSRQSYVVNDFFQSKLNCYTAGAVKYKLSDLAEGKHTLTFKVWNLVDVSATKTIAFEVKKGLTPEIFTVYNYPNPAKTETKIVVKHDRPETILNTSVEIFDLSGRKIWSFSETSPDDISWNLIAANGKRVEAGIYFYRVNIKTANSDICSKTQKIIIADQ